jgi:hypothetical protein
MYRTIQSTQWSSDICRYYTIVRTITGDETFRFLLDGGCSLVGKSAGAHDRTLPVDRISTASPYAINAPCSGTTDFDRLGLAKTARSCSGDFQICRDLILANVLLS